MKIGSREISERNPFIIAEIGSNHNQSLDQALHLMKIAKDCGADAVKFQSIKGEKMYSRIQYLSEKKLLEQIELNEGWYKRIFAYANEIGVYCLSAPTYLDAVDLLVKEGSKCIKIASPQTYGFPELIRAVDATGLPIIMSTGYCEEKELDRAVRLIRDKTKLVLLQCTSNYPTNPKDVNLVQMIKMRERYGVLVGLSDHTIGIKAPVYAVAMGASVIEKHLTISRAEDGPDHFFALEPNEFKQMVQKIREVNVYMGNYERVITDFERSLREKLEVRVFARKNIDVGQIITMENIELVRGSEDAISSWNISQILGRTAIEQIKIGSPINEKMVK